jgi:hypothetical protein
MRFPNQFTARSLARPGRRAAVTPGPRLAALLGTGVLAGGAFGGLALASARRVTVDPDNRLHGAMRASLEGTAGDAAEAVAPAADQAGKWWVYAPAALAAATAVLAAPGRTRGKRRGRRVGAAAIAIVPALATALSPAFDRWLPQPPIGPRRRPLDHPVFPSGHAFRATAVALATGYVVAREGLARPALAGALAGVAPAVVGLARLVREKHLASDVVGGWLAGTALAATAASAYELARAQRRPRRRRA